MNISIWFYLQKKRRGNKPETTENTSLWGRVWLGRVEESILGNKTFVRRHFIRVVTFEPCKYLTCPKYATHLPLHTVCFLLPQVVSLQEFDRLILSIWYLKPDAFAPSGTPQILDLLLRLVFLQMYTFT